MAWLMSMSYRRATLSRTATLTLHATLAIRYSNPDVSEGIGCDARVRGLPGEMSEARSGMRQIRASRPDQRTGTKPLSGLGVQAQAFHQALVGLYLRIAGRQQHVAAEKRVGAGQKAQSLQGVAHGFAAGGKAHVRTRHGDAGDGDGAYEFEWVQGVGASQRCA